jgi:prepilin-type N-terminal cleavage/methylation domain-containing protein
MSKQLGHFGDEDGFTLLETLITVAIISLLSIIIVAALGQVRTMSALSRQTDNEVRYGAIINYLDATLSEARPLRLLGRDGTSPVVIEGDADRLDFVSIVKTGTSTQSLREVIWSSTGDGTQVHFAQVTKARRLQPEQQVGDQDVLANGAFSVSFSYLADDRQQTGSPVWLNAWKSDHLPGAVQIKVQTSAPRPITITRIVPLRQASIPSR